MLLAEQDGRIVAALSGDRMIADPFRPTADLVASSACTAAGPARPGARPRVRVPNLHAA